MNAATGLGKDNPFKRRQAAAESFLPAKPTVESDDEDIDSTLASTIVSVSESPPPPPRREPEARVQFNNRMLLAHHRVLKRYIRQHGATQQATFDQMVTEYLERRGLL